MSIISGWNYILGSFPNVEGTQEALIWFLQYRTYISTGRPRKYDLPAESEALVDAETEAEADAEAEAEAESNVDEQVSRHSTTPITVAVNDLRTNMLVGHFNSRSEFYQGAHGIFG